MNNPSIKERSKKRKMLHVFFAFLIFFSGKILSPQKDAKNRKILCGFRFTLPISLPVVTEESENMLTFTSVIRLHETSYKVRWFFSCMGNPFRTSQISEIRKTALLQKEKIEQYKTFAIAQGVQGAMFRRSWISKGARNRVVEAYFATRDHEYKIYALAEEKTSLSPQEGDFEHQLASLMKTLLLEGKFVREINTTISESSYRKRIQFFIGIISVCLLFGTIALMAFYRSKKHQKNQ